MRGMTIMHIRTNAQSLEGGAAYDSASACTQIGEIHLRNAHESRTAPVSKDQEAQRLSDSIHNGRRDYRSDIGSTALAHDRRPIV